MKKIVLCICAIAIIAITAFNVNIGLRSNSLSGLTLATVVALTQDEGGNNGGKGKGWTSQPADRDCGLYFFPGYGWLPVSCQYDFCLTSESGSCIPGGNCCP